MNDRDFPEFGQSSLKQLSSVINQTNNPKHRNNDRPLSTIFVMKTDMLIIRNLLYNILSEGTEFPAAIVDATKVSVRLTTKFVGVYFVLTCYRLW